MRDGLLALLAFFLAVAVYMCADGCGLFAGDWRAGTICGVLHGQVDFLSSPGMTVSLGSYREIMFFRHTTVVRCGGTYLDFGANGALLLGCVAAIGVLIGMVSAIAHRKPKPVERHSGQR